jgi:hypothetical protein
MRKSLCVAVIAVACSAPWARAESVVVQTAHVKDPHGKKIPMPEPSSASILVVDLLAVGGLLFLFRRRRTV